MQALIAAFMSAILVSWFASVAQAATWQDRLLGQSTSLDNDCCQQIQQNRNNVKQRLKQAKTTKRRSNNRVVRIPVRRYKSNAKRGIILKGLASYYWQPQRVAAGGWFNPNALTAAHKSLPFGTRVRVTNLHNGRSVIVRINDRGPYIQGRIIDLSRRAATIIDMRKSGVVPVHVQVL